MTGSDFEKWSAEFRSLADVASQWLVTGSFVPDSFKYVYESQGQGQQRRNVKVERDRQAVIGDVVAAIFAGREVGLDPIASLRSIQIVSGTPAMSAQSMRALVQAAGHEVWLDHQSDERVVAKGRRANSGREHTSEWTIRRAEAMSLTGRPTWRAQPRAMLIARATSEVCRLTASDALLGLAYSVEEVTDAPELLGGTEEAPAARRRVQRASVPGQETPVAVPESPQDAPVEPPAGEDQTNREGDA